MGAKIEELENEVSARVEKDGELELKLAREREGQGVEAQLLLNYKASMNGLSRFMTRSRKPSRMRWRSGFAKEEG